ncbi:MAG: acetyltransferase [Bacteroidia bacterium]|nr:acetyltransferase [Bacteroidia bacterium]
MFEKSLILFACGSTLIAEYEELCLKNNVKIHLIINNLDPVYKYKNSVHVSKCDFSGSLPSFLVPLFTPHNRFIAVKEAIGCLLQPFNLLSDRNNDLPSHFTHGTGCFINKQVVIGADSLLGDFVTINRGASLGHHLHLDDYVSIGPGVVTGGHVTIFRGAMIGTGAVLLPGIEIGKHVIVGGGAVVTHDVPDCSIVVGNPAKIIRNNKDVF